ncbi:Thioredoxin [Candidatus Bilamarchaeum dharawalense]|uniref:Thioredoxin n=1 Tax=Candidatus Bilamarchaeum dharawalense TaxID=2885759 RepID=A0A5E4LRI5_9ARCH|nr:Thioredoxin [Candidatus Bilamarchaeum dharawalense]
MITELEQDPKITLKSVKAAVVVFYAPWCGDCKVSENYETQLGEEFADKIAFYRLDAVNFEEIADLYKVERYPTYIFFIKGKATKGVLVEPVELGEARNWLEIQLSKNRIS